MPYTLPLEGGGQGGGGAGLARLPLSPTPPPRGGRGEPQLRIGGFVPFTTTDYPGRLAAVVFCQGCPWRCAYCHNPHLLPAATPATHAWPDILAFLERRRGLLDAVVFSGGEPTLQAGLADAMRAVKALGFGVGLHSAGMYPERLARVLPLVDWLGLDVKAPLAAYPRITGVPGSGGRVVESLRLVLASGVDHELRCTWHPDLLSAADLDGLAAELRDLGVDRLTLQECRPGAHGGGLPDIRTGPHANAGVQSLAGHFKYFTLRPAH